MFVEVANQVEIGYLTSVVRHHCITFLEGPQKVLLCKCFEVMGTKFTSRDLGTINSLIQYMSNDRTMTFEKLMNKKPIIPTDNEMTQEILESVFEADVSRSPQVKKYIRPQLLSKSSTWATQAVVSSLTCSSSSSTET